MLRLVTGPFHPHLESALVSVLRELKLPDALAPVALIVPSDPLRDRLKRLLCTEHGLSLVNVHVLTFHQLALRLLSERGFFDPNRLRPPLYDDELVHHLLDRHPAGSAWRGLADMPGAWRGIVASLKDLKDAAVDPDRVAEIWNERGWGPAPDPQPLWLLYRQFLEMRRQLSAWDVDDLAVFAAAEAPRSTFLAGLRHLLYYGFYDLTQVQLDFFRAVIAEVPATLFFPLVEGHADFSFAQRFFDAHIRGLEHRESVSVNRAVKGEQLPLFDSNRQEADFDRPWQANLSAVSPRVISAGSRWDEVTTVAKDILGLVEERGYEFADIGVVARSLTGYDEVVTQVFTEQGIPVATDLGRPLAAWPYVKTVLQLLTVRGAGFHYHDVLELFSSPFFRLEAICPEPAAARSDLWRAVGHRLGLRKGRDEWDRMTGFFERGVPLHDSEDEGTGPTVPGSQVRLCWDTLTGLAKALEVIPDTGSWTEYADSLDTVRATLLDEESSEETSFGSAAAMCLQDVLNQLRRLDEFADTISLKAYAQAVGRAVDAARCASRSTRSGGVQVLDAMAARGLPFRALYVMGLNEKIFPRFIHEDAFVRDAVRLTLEQDLGYKIPAKLTGYEEERLLFSLLCRSAGEQLVLSYQRADVAGRPLMPSAYIEEICRQSSLVPVTVPRSSSARFKTVPQFRSDILTESELATRWLLERRVPMPLFERYPGGALLEPSLLALRAHEEIGRRLADFDGLIGGDSVSWKRLLSRGFSASALERYVVCPFQFFACSVLRIDQPESAMTADPIGPREQGILVHRILKRWMEELAAMGFFESTGAAETDALGQLKKCARAIFAEYEESHAVGYPLVWELRQQELLRFLCEVAPATLTDVASGWQPRLFEHAVAGMLTVHLPDGPVNLPVKGRLDRVDWSPARQAYRIIDYKFKPSMEIKAHEKNLALSAVQGRKLQPPLYLAMGEGELAQALGVPQGACDGVLFCYLAPQWDKRVMSIRFPGDAWRSSLRQWLAQTFTRIFTGIREGAFFIAPRESDCERCEFATVCRKTHQPTAWRARADLTTIDSYRRLRRARIPELGGEDTEREPSAAPTEIPGR